METTTFVFDAGTYEIKAGYAGETQPQTVVPNVYAERIRGPNMTQSFIGKDVSKAVTLDKLVRPFASFNQSQDEWADFEQIMKYILYEKLYAVDIKNFNMLITEKPFIPHVDNKQDHVKNREKKAELLFESCKASGIYYAVGSTLGLYSQGRTTGLTLDSGYEATYSVPVFEGYALPLAIKKIPMGGRTVDQFLVEKINENNPINITTSDALYLKENYAYVSKDFEKEKLYHRVNATDYLLPDGRLIEMTNEPYLSTEILFRPFLYHNVDHCGVTEMIDQSIGRCEYKLRKKMFANIAAIGGNSILKGFTKRIHRELVHLAPGSARIEIAHDTHKRYNTWIGGSLLASQSEFKHIWITKEMYEEFGANVIQYRCL